MPTDTPLPPPTSIPSKTPTTQAPWDFPTAIPSPSQSPPTLPAAKEIEDAVPECSAHPLCAEAGLDGVCCPSLDGWTLDCCTSVQLQETCSKNPACAALGLENRCCPTKDNVYLDCCSEMPDECGQPGVSCSVYSALQYQQEQNSGTTWSHVGLAFWPALTLFTVLSLL